MKAALVSVSVTQLLKLNTVSFQALTTEDVSSVPGKRLWGSLIAPLINILNFFIPIPIRTDRSLRTVPYVTYSLLFLNILIFLCTEPYSYLQYDEFINRWGLTLTHPSLLCLATYGFIHYDTSHLWATC